MGCGSTQLRCFSGKLCRPMLLRVEVPVALDSGSVQLLIETAEGQAGCSSGVVLLYPFEACAVS